jgi:hypothetical protein
MIRGISKGRSLEWRLEEFRKKGPPPEGKRGACRVCGGHMESGSWGTMYAHPNDEVFCEWCAWRGSGEDFLALPTKSFAEIWGK